jgi:hypothetical protein
VPLLLILWFDDMKLSIIALITSLGCASAFQPATFVRPKTTALSMGFDLSGNSWKPDSEKMGSTDTGDYFPEGYNKDEEVAFSSGMMGSQAMLNSEHDGPQLPGLENVGADAIMMGGIEQSSEIPAGMEFIPSSVPDGEYLINVAASSSGSEMAVSVKSPCMTFEDFFAAFSTDSHPSFSVTPQAGRMDRRSGEPTEFKVKCEPNGASGDLTGRLVINLPEDNSKLTYTFVAKSF